MELIVVLQKKAAQKNASRMDVAEEVRGENSTRLTFRIFQVSRAIYIKGRVVLTTAGKPKKRGRKGHQ